MYGIMFVSYRDYVLVFLITATFDLALNLLPPPIGATLIRDYFSQHTVLSAALIAGFIGAFTLPVIALFTTINKPSVYAVVVIFFVSAVIGFPMQWSGIFPHLNVHYYEKLPRYQTFLADGLSGLMVAHVYWLLNSRVSQDANKSLLLMWTLIVVMYAILVKSGIILF